MIQELLTDSPVFKNINIGEITHLLNVAFHQVKKYKPGEVIAWNGDECNHLIIILKGKVKGEMIDFSGKTITIEEKGPLEPIATAFIFGTNNKYPVNIVANAESELLFIPKESVIKLMQGNERFLQNFLDSISNRSQFLANKIRFLSFKTIKGKIALYILQLAKENKTAVTIPHTQQEIADLFGVARPSLARSLGELEDEGILKTDRKELTILSREKLSKFLNSPIP